VLWPRLPSDHRGGGRGHFCSGCRVPFASVNGAAIHYGLGPPRTPARGPSVVFVHGAGHMVMLEKPGEFNRILMVFLEDHLGSSA